MQIWWIAELWLVAAAARAGLIGTAPVLPLLRTTLHLSYSQVQVLFALPVLVTGLLSIPGGMLADRYGARATVFTGLLLVGGGEILRALAHGFWGYGVWALVFGAGIGIIQPSLPKLTRQLFPGRTQTFTGIYTSGFVAGAAIGGWLSSPLLTQLLGWRGALMFWGVLCVLPALPWLFLIPHAPPRQPGPARSAPPAWRDRNTWLLAGLDLAQTVAFYTLSAWLPTYLQQLGWSAARVSVPYAVFESAAIPAVLLAPWLMERWGRRRPLMTFAALMFLTGAVGFTVSPTHGTMVWVLLDGLSNAIPFAMALALPAELAPAEQVASMSGIILTVGYAGAVIGPPVAGALRDATGVPAAGMIPILIAALGMVTMASVIPERGRRRGPVPDAGR